VATLGGGSGELSFLVGGDAPFLAVHDCESFSTYY
jgi:hypothetical protein